MRAMPEGSVAAVVVDPPYGLEFMGKTWDKLDWTDGGSMTKTGIGERNIPWPSYSGTGAAGTANATCAKCKGRMRGANLCECGSPDWRIKGRPLDAGANAKRMQAQQAWHLAWLVEAYRVLEPGGVLKTFGGTRVFHRLAGAMEAAGFEGLRLEAWGYGSGFPKSHSVSKSIDKRAGVQGEIIGHTRGVTVADNHGFGGIARGAVGVVQKAADIPVRALVTPEAVLWVGWGTALKPVWEPVLVAAKRG